jgi:hypothetical protein
MTDCGDRLAACWRSDEWTTRVKSLASDRRGRIRFEVFGFFWGSLDVGESVRVHNLTSHGALIEADGPLAVESIQSIRLVMDGQVTVSDAHVRHVRALPGEPPLRYLVGVEFISPSSAFQEAVERLIAYRSLPTDFA